MLKNKGGWLPYLPLGIAVLTLSAPLLLSGKAMYWGTPGLQFVPWREAAFDAIRGGYLPLWNPLVGMGAPLLANYQSALIYPPTWLLFLLSTLGGVAWHAWGQMFLVALHWIAAGTGMVLLARRLGLKPLSQAVSGLSYGLGAYLVSRAGFLSINAAAAWLPWIVYYAGQLASPRLRGGGRKVSALLKLALVAALQLLAGHAQTAWYTLLLAFIWGGYWAWLDGDRPNIFATSQTGRRVKSTLTAWAFLGGGYLLVACLAAVQLLPTAEYLLQSQRGAAVDYELAMTYSFWPWRLLTLLAPGLFGSPASADYWGYGNYWEDALYIGLFPLILAILGSAVWLTRRRKVVEPEGSENSGEAQARWEAVPLLQALTGISLLLALGKNTPVIPWLYRHVPTFDMFQAPARFTLWAAFSLPLLAGFGVEGLHRPEKRALYWTRLGTAGAAAVTIGAGLAWYLMGEVSPTFIRATALAGLFGVGVGALCLLAPPRGEMERAGVWHWAVAVFIAADLVVAGWMLNPGVEASFFSQDNDQAEAVREMLAGRRLYISSDDEYTLKYERFFRFDAFNSGEDPSRIRTVFLPNINMLDGIPTVNNFDPLVPAYYPVWMDGLNLLRGTGREAWLDISGAGAIESIDPQAPDGVRFTALPANTGMRVRLIQCKDQEVWQPYDQFITSHISQTLDIRQEVILDNTSGEGFLCRVNGSPESVETKTDLPDKLVLETQAEAKSWLLLSDTWYPGWRASVDGSRRPIYRANMLFRAVEINPGDREVVFKYSPASFWVGAALSLMTCLGLLAAVFTLKRWKAVSTHQPKGEQP